MPGPGVEVTAGRVLGVRPERDVFAVAPAVEVGGVETARVRPERGLGERREPGVPGPSPDDQDPSRDGTTRSTVAITPRFAAHAAQTSLEPGLREHEVAFLVGHRRVEERDVGRERGDEAEVPERGVYLAEARVHSIEEPASEPVTTAGNPRAAASRRWT